MYILINRKNALKNYNFWSRGDADDFLDWHVSQSKNSSASPNEWCEIFGLYNLEYDDENEPFQLFDIQKAVELSKGVEPVWYDQRGGMKNRDVILSKMIWKNGAWKVRNKVKGFIKWGFR